LAVKGGKKEKGVGEGAWQAAVGVGTMCAEPEGEG